MISVQLKHNKISLLPLFFIPYKKEIKIIRMRLWDMKTYFIIIATTCYLLCNSAIANPQFCKNNIDCPQDEWCIKRADNIRVCTNSKAENELAYCKSSIDCPGDERCITRADHIKVCTQSKINKKNAYCQSSIDCPGDQFCKNRGDGMKVCM